MNDLVKYEKTFCSQCGGEFGPGEHGFSSCADHMKRCETCRFRMESEERYDQVICINPDSKCYSEMVECSHFCDKYTRETINERNQ